MSQSPQYRPLSFLSALATHIDGMLQADEEQYQTLLPAQSKPHVLDDFTVNKVIQVFNDAKQDLPLFDEQLRRWGAEKVTAAQRQEINRLKGQMQKVHEVVDKTLALASELSEGTIEKQLAKSDEQLGMEALLRMFGGDQKPKSGK
jgi:hypothetical protein